MPHSGNRLTVRIKALARMLKDRISPSLCEVILDAANPDTLSRKVSSPNHHTHYMCLLAEEVRRISSEEKVRDATVESLLWRVNFNAPGYYHHYIGRIRTLTDQEKSPMEKYRVFIVEHKKARQQISLTGLAYNENLPALKEMVANWLEAEMTAIEKTVHLYAGTEENPTRQDQDFKLNLDLSVAQLACLTRGLVESRVILNANLTALASFLSSRVITKRSEHMSDGSFRRKYYNIETGTGDAALEVVDRLRTWFEKNPR